MSASRMQQKAEPSFFSFMPRDHGSQRSQLKALISPCDFDSDFDFVSLPTIAYRRLSALGRDKLVVGGGAVMQLHHLVTRPWLLASLVHHQHLTNTSAPILPSFLLSTLNSYLTTTPATTTPTTKPPLRLQPASSLTQSGAFTDVLHRNHPSKPP